MPSRHRKLDTVIARLQLQYGPRALQRAGLPGTSDRIGCIPTTFSELDAVLTESRFRGGGGLPRGRITEIVGPATSGKVTLAAKVVAAAHRERGALAAWLDLSRTCDPDYLHRCGVDLSRLLVVRPEDGRDALAITLHLVESNTLAVLIFDGVVDLMRLASDDESLMTGALERLGIVVTRTLTAVLFLSEPGAQYRTLAHLATVRLKIARERWLTRHGDVHGYEGQVQILKNKIGRSGIVVPIRIIFNGTVRSHGLW